MLSNYIFRHLVERQEDILPLIHHFLPNRHISLSAEKALLQHAWPGNVRELENACKRVAVLKPEGILEVEDFALVASTAQTASNGLQPIAEPDKAELEQAMREQQGVIARVARQFGMSRQALYQTFKQVRN